MFIIIVLIVTVMLLVIGFGVLQRHRSNPERTLLSWKAGQIERFYAVTCSPEYLIYMQASAEPDLLHKERLIEALGESAPNDLRSGQTRVVEDSLIRATVSWATGRSATGIQNAGASDSLTTACESTAEAMGLRMSTFEVLAVAALDDGLRNLAHWCVNGAYYDRGDDKERSDHINAAVVELDAQGAGRIMVRSRPKRGATRFRPSTEVVSNPALAVEVFAVAGGFGPTRYRSFEEIRRDAEQTDN